MPSQVNPRRFLPPYATVSALSNCGHRLRFERDGSVANDPNSPSTA